jgi:PAT family beta-lactamase induction signal transducer AmpG
VSDAVSPAQRERGPWWWVPSLYFAEAVPLVVVTFLATVMYKRLDVSNTWITLIAGWLYLPWVIKPLWSMVVQGTATRRGWTLAMELFVAVTLAALAASMGLSALLPATVVAFAVLAFLSATHDVAADGFYLAALDERQQAFFVGIRGTAYRVANVVGRGLLLMLAGSIEAATGDVPTAWRWVYAILAAIFAAITVYHAAILPRPAADRRSTGPLVSAAALAEPVASFFRKPGIVSLLAFLLLFRFAEAQLVSLVSPFLLDGRDRGGLGLSTAEVGFVYGTLGIGLLSLGGILGGVLVARDGFTRWLWPMALAINLPNLAYVWLAWAQPESRWAVALAVGVEQFGYGFGFTAYMVACMLIARGSHETVHYALCTGFMAAGMMLPGMASGWIQEQVGYPQFFAWVMLATIPSFLATACLRLDPAPEPSASDPGADHTHEDQPHGDRTHHEA